MQGEAVLRREPQTTEESEQSGDREQVRGVMVAIVMVMLAIVMVMVAIVMVMVTIVVVMMTIAMVMVTIVMVMVIFSGHCCSSYSSCRLWLPGPTQSWVAPCNWVLV